MNTARMSIREDPMGNIWGKWTGSDADAGRSEFDHRVQVSLSLRVFCFTSDPDAFHHCCIFEDKLTTQQ